jgi:ribonuclease J
VSEPIRFVALGGLGEVGMNCSLLEHGDDAVVIDCGIGFRDRELGVDIVRPDLRYPLQRAERLRALVVTHAHEDHIGAVQYLLRHVDLPIYGPAFALALIGERLQGASQPVRPPRMHAISPGRRFRLGAFELEPLRVTHSMPDSTCLAIHTPVGIVVFSGDFKIDEQPYDGERFDAGRLEELGREGVRLLLSDSTNIDVEGSSGSETNVARAIEERVARAAGRVVVCLFSSNTHRLRAVLRAARRNDREVLLLGRSVLTYHRVASELGLIPDPEPVFASPDNAQDIARSRLLVAATGTQGEPRAALARLADGSHDLLQLEEGDEVILSSRIIPGNERAVLDIIDRLERDGIRVWHRGFQSDLHSSGHACREEQRKLIELMKPRTFVPIHGSRYHLNRHADLAREAGVRETVTVENGAVVEIGADATRLSGAVPCGRVYLQNGSEIEPEVLGERRLLAQYGIALVTLTVDDDGELLYDPEVVMKGVAGEQVGEELAESAARRVEKALARLSLPADDDEIRKAAESAARAFFRNELGFKPVVRAVIMRIGS